MVNMRVAFPPNAQNMLLEQARMVYWKRWAAKHECGVLKARGWLDPIQAMLRRKAKETWTDKQRNVTRQRELWKEDGCRIDCTTLVGQTTVTKNKA